jgi:hypothetical protein
MRNALLLCLLLSGCATNNLPVSVSYIYVNIPDTQSWKLISEEDEKWMEGIIKNCGWVNSVDVNTSKYAFEVTSNGQTYLGQLLDGSLYMASGSVIYKCQLDNSSVKRVESLYASYELQTSITSGNCLIFLSLSPRCINQLSSGL